MIIKFPEISGQFILAHLALKLWCRLTSIQIMYMLLPKSKNNNHLVFVSTHTIVGLIPCSGSLFTLISILCISPRILCFVRPRLTTFTDHWYASIKTNQSASQFNATTKWFQACSKWNPMISVNCHGITGPFSEGIMYSSKIWFSIGYPPCLGIVLEKLESGDSVGFKLSWALKVNSGSVHFWKISFVNLWVEFEK